MPPLNSYLVGEGCWLVVHYRTGALLYGGTKNACSFCYVALEIGCLTLIIGIYDHHKNDFGWLWLSVNVGVQTYMFFTLLKFWN
jgi:hypothetical protein